MNTGEADHVTSGLATGAATVGFFSDENPPILVVNSGETIRYENLPSAFGGRIDDATSIEDILRIRAEYPFGPHTVVGPVFVNDAAPGDVLEVEIQNLIPASPAMNFCLPTNFGLGAAPERFPNGFLRRFDIEHGAKSVPLGPELTIPLAPFPGIVGLLPSEAGRHSTVPPGDSGGNLDLRELTAGSRIFLPVQRVGALLYFGDFHAAQGDGEVNLTALEIGAERFDIRVVLHQRLSLQMPVAETSESWIAIGLGGSLDDAFQSALKNTLSFLETKAGLSAEDAYCLASAAVNFRITQVVNRVKGVHSIIPKQAFSSVIHERLRHLFG